MAPVKLPCPTPECVWETVALEFEQAKQLLDQHVGVLHPLPAQQQQVAPPGQCRARLDAPKLTAGASQDTWDTFIRTWQQYKQAMNITTQASTFLFNTLDEDLRQDVFRAHPDKDISAMNETDLVKSIKHLAVIVESELVHRIKMSEATQTAGSSVRTFNATLKGIAKHCQFQVKCHACEVKVDYSSEMIKDQIIRGLSDREIVSDLLGDTKTDRDLEEVVDYIDRKERGKLEHGRVGVQTTNAVKLQHVSATKCWACLGPSHGTNNNFKSRKDNCPEWETVCDKCKVKGHKTQVCSRCSHCSEWGHKNKASKKCKNKENTTESGAILSELSSTFVGQQLCGCFQLSDLSLATVGYHGKRSIPLSHHIFEKFKGWANKPSAPQPVLKVDAELCPDDHAEFGFQLSSVSEPKSISSVFVVADSGCQSTAIPPSFAYKAGIKRKDFMPVASRMNGAGRGSDLGVIGGVVMKFSSKTIDGNTVWTKQLCYVCENVSQVYLSRQALEELGSLPSYFPLPAPPRATAASMADTTTPCSCPKRPTSPPPLPTELPERLSGDESSVSDLKTWLLNYYASTTFNTCEHTPLPTMRGSPLKLYIDEQAKPVAFHKVNPVPIHWQSKVKADLDRDVALGVLEKIGDNTPVAWQSKMVITAKANGDPRRVVDLQNLNRHSSRQTFPVSSPFHLATQIPLQKKKSVVDAWNGYHSVPIDPDDRHYTCFLTPWGRYQYKRSPQGHLVSGDGYNERYDSITQGFPNIARCVDDTALWADGVRDSFLHVARYLDLCARNGIVLNPDKFQFCQDVVLFAGLEVTPTNIRPSCKFLDAIRNFPAPRDISGARAWFGLVNQGNYAFSMTEEMAPFRHLLSPKTKFEWTKEMEEVFVKSKESIVNKIIEGVRLFDPSLPTCVATDFSGTGVGFFLLQKTCSCSSRLPTCCQTGWRLCLVGSRFLHDAETRYAPIEGEALAVAYALHQCRYFVLGCPDLIVATDHKPLTSVLNDRSLADIQNRRLQNLKEKTLSYRFSIVHVPGRKQLGADATSRYPVGDPVRLVLPGEPPETDFASTTELRAVIMDNIAIRDSQDTSLECEIMSDSCACLDEIRESVFEWSPTNLMNMATTNLSTHIVSWDDMKEATVADKTIQEILGLLQSGFPTDGRSLPPHVRPYLPLADALYEVDGVLMMNSRIVVPASLRPNILHLLHAAHQGTDRMKARATDTVYWPNMTVDITRTRLECQSCNKMAKSNPTQPPFPPKDPEYPFQMLASDYFHYCGKCYVVIVDRYSHWPLVFQSEHGAKGLVSILRRAFSDYGICEEIATDGGPEYTAGETQNFLKLWGVHHRLSSVAFPHSNCRAELAVKQVKRIIVDNCSPAGSLDVDKFHKAILSYRNTIDPVTKFSPALAVFGRQIRDGLPIAPGHYNPHETWKELLQHREKALAKRHVASREAWSEHTRKLPPLSQGDQVFVQNQIGPHPRRWERTGRILELKGHDQYLVKVDGTGRTTLRNRKFLRKFSPIPKFSNSPLPASDIVYRSPSTPPCPTSSQATAKPPVYTVSHHPQSNTDEPIGMPEFEPRIPDTTPVARPTPSRPHTSGTPRPSPSSPVRSPPLRSETLFPTPTPSSEPSSEQLTGRPQRTRKPNVLYNPEEWDLDSIKSIMTMEGALEMIKAIAEKVQVDSEDSFGGHQSFPRGGR